MVDSITSTTATPRTPATGQVSSLRNNATVLNTITQAQQKQSGATNRVTALAVPQSAKSGNTSNTRLPRGSLIDVLA